MRVSRHESALGKHFPCTGVTRKLHCECTSTPEYSFSILRSTHRVNTNFYKKHGTHPSPPHAGAGAFNPLQTPYGQKDSPPYGRGVDRTLPTVAFAHGKCVEHSPMCHTSARRALPTPRRGMGSISGSQVSATLYQLPLRQNRI